MMRISAALLLVLRQLVKDGDAHAVPIILPFYPTKSGKRCGGKPKDRGVLGREDERWFV